jgi:PAS domain S-box-containing protein
MLISRGDKTARKLKTDEQPKLRAEAEARFASAPPSAEPNQSTAALVHELQVHQIELEMQNEELRRNQLELEKAHDRHVDLYDFAPVGYVTLDENGVVTDANLTAAGLLGRSRKYLVGHPFAKVVSGEDVDGWHRFLSTLARTDAVQTCRTVLTRRGGTFDALLACERREGAPTGAQVRVVLTDVTVLAQAERALRESERWLRMSQAITRVGHYVFEVGEDHWTSSPTLDSIFGIDETFPRRAADWLRVIHPDDQASMKSYLADLLARGAQFDLEYRVVDQRSGEVRWVHGLGELQRAPGGAPIRLVGTIQDITKRKRLEEERNAAQAQLALAARLAAMGTLVTGVAHEINNPLAAALADEEMALAVAKELLDAVRCGGPLDRETASTQLEDMVEMLTDAQEGGRRIAQIVRDLAAFGRPDQKRTLVRLIDVVQAAMRWLPAAVGRAAKVDVQDGGAPDVLASFGQMEQVLVNLVTNAAKATKDGEAGNIIVRVGPGVPGMASLEVIDRGVGIEPDVLERVFEPFFTKSAIGQGMGLGLSICKVIVADHGGTLTVESEVGKGSTFRVELPAAPVEA